MSGCVAPTPMSCDADRHGRCERCDPKVAKDVARRPNRKFVLQKITLDDNVLSGTWETPPRPISEIEKLLDDVIDATFMKRGFNAQSHRKAILSALDVAGYDIVKRFEEE